eukprot:154411-Hanusia_phi.AAC.1
MEGEGKAEADGDVRTLPSQPAEEAKVHSPEGSQHDASHRKPPDAIDETGISFDISGSSQIGSTARRPSRKNDGVDSSWHNMDGTTNGGKRNYFANRAILASGPPRPKPNPADVKLMDSANISHEFYVPFSEIQWISNLSEGGQHNHPIPSFLVASPPIPSRVLPSLDPPLLASLISYPPFHSMA